MKKLFFLSLTFLFILTNTKAQKAENFLKIHTSAEFTTGLFDEGYKTGWGIYVTDYYKLIKYGDLVFSSGIAGWKVKNGPGSAGMLLTRVGYRQFLSDGFYFQGDAGFGVGFKNFSGPARFTFGGGFGYVFKSKNGSGVDISARVNRGFIRTWIGLGIGYQFKL